MREMAAEGADAVVLTRGAKPALFLEDGEIAEIRVPELQVVDEHGAGDSLTGAVAAALSEGASLGDAVVLGVAAGANNVTRHGLGSGNVESIRRLASLVEVMPFDEEEEGAAADEQASPQDLARKARIE
jgi:1-phosphofructokinase